MPNDSTLHPRDSVQLANELFKRWYEDLSLKRAFKYSCVWYYQELARRVGPERMKKLEGKTLSILYKGAYSGLGEAYAKLAKWINKNNYHSMNITYEYFDNSPADVPEAELLTRIVMLIKE